MNLCACIAMRKTRTPTYPAIDMLLNMVFAGVRIYLFAPFA